MLISPLLVKYGYNINQEVFVGALTGIIGLILAIWSSKNPNTIKILGNSPTTINTEGYTEPLNPEYEDGA